MPTEGALELLRNDARVIDRLMIELVWPDLMRGPATCDFHRVPQEICRRAWAWLQTTTQLDNPGDVFCVAAAARALLESLVDLYLLRNEQYGFARMSLWELSAKISAAEKLIEKAKRSRRSLPAEIVEWFSKNSAAAQDFRNCHGGRHPGRWTGRGLEKDIRRVDQFERKRQPIYLESSLSDFATTFYYQSCGFVHASGLTNIRGDKQIENLPVAYRYFQRHVNILMLYCIDLTLRSVAGDLVLSQTKERFAQINSSLHSLYGPIEAGLRSHGF